MSSPEHKKHILVTDDSAFNREYLSEMLSDDYEILEAADGQEAICQLEQLGRGIDLVLLDMVMPGMDGFEVLRVMQERNWLEDIPVIMISSENGADFIQQAYELGVTEFIGRPFDISIVRHRIDNTIMLYAKQRTLQDLVQEQVAARQKDSNLLISILSHVVEFRNGESGLHVLHIRTITSLLLETLARITDRYPLDEARRRMISMASSLHDIGKIAIPEEILNKPGKLTPAEFEVIKTHSTVGAQMMDALPFYRDEPLVRYSHQICRWHHERWDGKGYPDGLSGDEIPIAAQVVAMADVYDALTSKRCYKPAYSHEESVRMILNGECGQFNPLLLQCLTELGDELRTAILRSEQLS